MSFWNKQAMSRKNRPMVEESDAIIVFEDNASSDFATHDFAKEACGVDHLIAIV